MPLDELLIGTSNPGKVKEIQASLSELPLRLRVLSDYPDLAPPAETGATYFENAIIKAQAYAAQTGLCALADDSGLEVVALGGAPGLRSARFGRPALSDSERCKFLLHKLSQASGEDRSARFVCVMAIADPILGVINIAEGKCLGIIAEIESGSSGFGFDPVFIPHGYRLTFAELPVETKNRISHRAVALLRTREMLQQLINRNLTANTTGS
jgi:XTP/dITP diphosphohydrolase